jgi:hypothetical protein
MVRGLWICGALHGVWGYAPVDDLLFQGSVRGFCACPGNELQKRSAIGRFFRWIGAFSDQKNVLS